MRTHFYQIVLSQDENVLKSTSKEYKRSRCEKLGLAQKWNCEVAINKIDLLESRHYAYSKKRCDLKGQISAWIFLKETFRK